MIDNYKYALHMEDFYGNIFFSELLNFNARGRTRCNSQQHRVYGFFDNESLDNQNTRKY